MGTLLPGALNQICIEEVDFGSPVSEAIMTKISANINALISRQWRINTFTDSASVTLSWECPSDINSGSSQSSAFIFVIARGASGGGGGGASAALAPTVGGDGGATLFDNGNGDGLEIQFPGGLGGEQVDGSGTDQGPGRHFMPGEVAGTGSVGGDFEDFARNAPAIADRAYPPTTGCRDSTSATAPPAVTDANPGLWLARVLTTRNFSVGGSLNYSEPGAGGGFVAFAGTKGGGSGTPTVDVTVIQPAVAPGVIYPIEIGLAGTAGVNTGGGTPPGAGNDGELKILYYSAFDAVTTV